MQSLRFIVLVAVACLFLAPLHAQLQYMPYEVLAKYLLTYGRVAQYKDYLLSQLLEDKVSVHLDAKGDGAFIIDEWSSVKESEVSTLCYLSYRLLCGDTLETMKPSLKGQYLLISSSDGPIHSLKLSDGIFRYEWPGAQTDIIQAVAVAAEQTKTSIVLHAFLNNDIMSTNHMLSCPLEDPVTLSQAFLAAMLTLNGGNLFRNSAKIPVKYYPDLSVEVITSRWNRQDAMLKATTPLALAELIKHEKLVPRPVMTETMPLSVLKALGNTLKMADTELAAAMLDFLCLAVKDDTKLKSILAWMLVTLEKGSV